MFKVKYRDTCESVREHLLQLEDKKSVSMNNVINTNGKSDVARTKRSSLEYSKK